MPDTQSAPALLAEARAQAAMARDPGGNPDLSSHFEPPSYQERKLAIAIDRLAAVLEAVLCVLGDELVSSKLKGGGRE